MKRIALIALCCTMLLASCKKEKPYERFVGEYAGQVLINGAMTISSLNFTQNFENQPLDLEFTLTKGSADDQVILTYTPEGQSQTFTTTGTIDKDRVDFAPVYIDQDIEASNVKSTIDLEGILSGNQLAMQGTVNGNGTLKTDDIIIPVVFTITGTMSGTLYKKTVAPEP